MFGMYCIAPLGIPLPPGLITRMADFEVLGRSIAGHAGYDADGFAESLRSALDGTTPGAS